MLSIPLLLYSPEPIHITITGRRGPFMCRINIIFTGRRGPFTGRRGPFNAYLSLALCTYLCLICDNVFCEVTSSNCFHEFQPYCCNLLSFYIEGKSHIFPFFHSSQENFIPSGKSARLSRFHQNLQWYRLISLHFLYMI